MVTVKVCPKCGSENVKIDPTNVRSAVGLSQPHYLCLDCGFSGTFFPEIDKDVPKSALEGSEGEDSSKESESS